MEPNNRLDYFLSKSWFCPSANEGKQLVVLGSLFRGTRQIQDDEYPLIGSLQDSGYLNVTFAETGRVVLDSYGGNISESYPVARLTRQGKDFYKRDLLKIGLVETISAFGVMRNLRKFSSFTFDEILDWENKSYFDRITSGTPVLKCAGLID